MPSTGSKSAGAVGSTSTTLRDIVARRGIATNTSTPSRTRTGDLPVKAASTGRAKTALGDREAVLAGVERYRAAGATVPCIGPIAKTDFDATLRAEIASTS